MRNEQPIEVKLLADFVDGKPIYEAVPAIKVGENRFKLTASPGFSPGFARGDEIEAAPSETVGYKIVKRSGNICIQLFLFECTPQDKVKIADLANSIGGWLDGGSDRPDGHLLVLTIPVDVGFELMEKMMNKIQANFTMDKWMYGNVYDTRDGVTPLNWWA
jgi:hypothetical protein